jgi:xanthine dehydrogenase accessory factor
VQTLATGVPQLLDYGITNERAWEVGLACGGSLTILLERVG